MATNINDTTGDAVTRASRVQSYLIEQQAGGGGGGGGGGSTTLAGLTDVGGTPTSRDSLFYDGSATKPYRRLAQQLFYVDSYLPEGVTRATATGTQIFDAGVAAYAAAVAAPAGGVVQFGAGVYAPDKPGTSSYWLGWSAFHGNTKHVTIRGEGDATVIKLSTNQKTFIQPGNGYGTGLLYQNLTLEDFTVDCNNIAAGGSSNYGVIMLFGGRCSIDNLNISRVDTVNVGGLVTSGFERRNIDITIFSSGYTDSAAPFSLTNIRIEDCIFGRYGGGGNYGVLIQGFASNNGTLIQEAQIPDPGGMSQCFLDEIHITRCKYDSGGVVPGGTQSYSSTGFMVGGNGLGQKLRITDCTAANSCDDGFEINSFYDAIIRGCTSINCPQEGFYCVNLGGMPQPERQRISFIDCRTLRTASLGGSLSAFGFGARYKRASPHGTLEYINCSTSSDSTTGFLPQQLNLLTQFRKVIIRNFHYAVRETLQYTANSQFVSRAPIRIGNPSGRGVLDIDGLSVDFTASLDRNAKTGGSYIADLVQIDYASDLTIKARNIDHRIRVNLTQAGGDAVASWSNLQANGFKLAATAQNGDSNYTFTTLAAATNFANYVNEAGALSDWTGNANGGSVTTGPFAEHRLRDIFGSGTHPGMGTQQDMGAWVQGITPSSLVAGFKLAVQVKGVEAAGSARTDPVARAIDAYIVYDGTSWFLCLDKVDYTAGTRSSLLGSIIGSPTTGQVGAVGTSAITTAGGTGANYSDRGVLLAALSAATTYYVRAIIRDNVVLAELFTSAPSQSLLTGSATATTGSITLGTADTLLYGEGVHGWPSMSIVATDGTARLVTLNLVRCHVIRGRIENFTYLDAPTTVKTYSPFVANYTSTQLRLADLSLHGTFVNATTSGLLTSFDATQQNGVRWLPGTRLPGPRTIGALTFHPMLPGAFVGGNAGTAFTVNAAGAPDWYETRTLDQSTCTITLSSAIPAGSSVVLELTQGTGGSKTITLASGAGGTIKGPTYALSTAAGSIDVLSLYNIDGTNWRLLGVQKALV